MSHSSYISIVNDMLKAEGDTFDRLELLRCFDQVHWQQFIEDVISDHANAYKALSPAVGVDILTALSVLLNRLAQCTKKLASEALASLLAITLNSSEGNPDKCANAIFLAIYVPSAHISELLQGLVVNPGTPAPLVYAAAKFLANENSTKSQLFWDKFEIRDNANLAWAMVVGLSSTNPLRAIQKLNEIDRPIEHLDMLESPLRLTLRSLLVRRSDRERLFHILDSAPKWLSDVYHSVLSFKEFRELSEDYLRYTESVSLESESWKIFAETIRKVGLAPSDIEQLMIELNEILRQSGSFEILMSYIKGIKDLAKHDIMFASLEEAITNISGRQHNRVYLLLDRPLNAEGVFFDYLCDLISRNTTVVMYSSKDYVFEVERIEKKLSEAVGETAVKAFFNYSSAPENIYLNINCIIIDPWTKIQRVYYALRGQDRKSVVAIKLPPGETANEIVKRAEEILSLDPKISKKLKFPENGGAA